MPVSRPREGLGKLLCVALISLDSTICCNFISSRIKHQVFDAARLDIGMKGETKRSSFLHRVHESSVKALHVTQQNLHVCWHRSLTDDWGLADCANAISSLINFKTCKNTAARKRENRSRNIPPQHTAVTRRPGNSTTKKSLTRCTKA